MDTSEVLIQFRQQYDLTDDELAEVLGLTRARWNQYEHREPIPLERIHAWVLKPNLPDWARQLVNELWLAHIRQQHQAVGEQLQQLRGLLAARERRVSGDQE